MKKELRDKLLKYSGAATAVLATGVTANGQIVYSQVNKTITASSTNPAALDSIDINNDGTFDLGILAISYATYGLAVISGGPLNSQGHAMAGSVAGTASYYYNYPFKLANGNAIKTQQFLPADASGTFAFYYNSTNPYNEFWNGGVTDGYLGMKLQVGGNTHYGWVRMYVSAAGNQVVIKDMAYESTPDKDINAGQGMLSLDKYQGVSNSAWISQKQLITDIEVSFNSGSIQLLDMGGKPVKNIELTESKATFDLSDLPAGTYILSLNLDGNLFNKQALIQ